MMGRSDFAAVFRLFVGSPSRAGTSSTIRCILTDPTKAGFASVLTFRDLIVSFIVIIWL